MIDTFVVRPLVIAIVGLFGSGPVADAEPEVAIEVVDSELSAPVVYQDLMLILTTPKGAAAVVFTDTFEEEIDGETHYGVGYRFRYESADGKEKLSGKGKVFERYIDGQYNEGELSIVAGPIELVWSRGSTKMGWIYYSPEKVRVQIAHAQYFERREIRPGRVGKKLDLKRFMKE